MSVVYVSPPSRERDAVLNAWFTFPRNAAIARDASCERSAPVSVQPLPGVPVARWNVFVLPKYRYRPGAADTPPNTPCGTPSTRRMELMYRNSAVDATALKVAPASSE